MAPEFALFLSPDGIALAHRQPAGHWAVLADTALDVPDLPAALAAMRQKGEDRAGPGFATLVILPDDQILFTSLTAPGPEDADRLEQIRGGLDGLTPYEIPDLAFDFVPLEDGRVKLAVVARETLAEAEGFARENGFEPAGFAARPLDNRYPGVAHFDRSPDWTAAIADIEFGHDSWRKPDADAERAAEAATDAGEDPLVEETGAPEAEAEATADTLGPQTDGPPAPAEDEGPKVGTVPADATAGAPDPHEVGPQGAEADGPGDDISDLAPTTEDNAEENVGAGAGEPALPDPPGEAKIAAATGTTDAPGPDAQDAPLQMPSGFGAGRARSGEPATAADRVGSRPSRLAIGGADTAAGDAAEKSARPRFGRGKAQPASAAPDAMPKRPAAAGPAPDLPPLTRTKLTALRKGKGKKAPASPQRPALQQTPDPGQPTGGRAERPSARDRLSGMGKRLSAGADRARESAAGLTGRRRPGPDATKETEPQTAGVGSITARLKSLGRKSRPAGADGSVAPNVTPDPTSAATPASTRVPPADIAPPPVRGRPRLPAAKRARPARVPPSPTDADTSLTGGLLGREKYPDSRGPSLRAGLILTLILLAVLGLIAVWAVFYLPDTALARWLGMGRQDAGIEQVDGAPQISDAPQFSGVPQQGADTGPSVASLTPEDSAPQVSGMPPEAPDLLPDIDADLDLGPVPVPEPRVDPETLLPSVSEAEDFYARTGIWQRPPVIDLPNPETVLQGVIFAGIDPPVSSLDAYALPVPAFNPAADLPRRQSSPIDPATEFVFGENGLVVPTPEGTLNPDGILIIAGAPELTPPQRPGDAPAATADPTEEAAAADPTAGAIDTALLGTRRPAERPADLQEQRERALLGGITFAELSQIRPEGRPASIQELAAAEAEAAHNLADAEADAAEITSTSEWAVAVSFVPRARPGNINEIVETARAAAAPDASASTAGAANAVAPVAARPSDTVQPDIPSSASVTRAATRENAINLHRINLIGVTGSDSERRALVRLPSGRFVTVEAGDRLDGGRVAAIGQTSLQYVKAGRTVTLEVPSG